MDLVFLHLRLFSSPRIHWSISADWVCRFWVARFTRFLGTSDEAVASPSLEPTRVKPFFLRCGLRARRVSPSAWLSSWSLGCVEPLRFYESVSKKELFGRRFDGAFFCGVFCRSCLLFTPRLGRFIHRFGWYAGEFRSHFIFEGQEVGMKSSQPSSSLEPTPITPVSFRCG